MLVKREHPLQEQVDVDHETVPCEGRGTSK